MPHQAKRPGSAAAACYAGRWSVRLLPTVGRSYGYLDRSSVAFEREAEPVGVDVVPAAGVAWLWRGALRSSVRIRVLSSLNCFVRSGFGLGGVNFGLGGVNFGLEVLGSPKWLRG